jgi:50S ribosomal protein L16 3-hydroxylase
VVARPLPFPPDELRGAPAGTGPAGTGPAGTGPAGTGPAGTGPADTGPADGFWREFAPYYGQEPFETDNPPPDLAVSSADLFRLLIRAAAERGPGPTTPQIRFHIGQRQVIADLDDYVPVVADGSIDGYLARMEHELGGEPYLLVVERGHVSSRKIWKQAASFLAGLYGATGAVPGSVDVEVFVGRYPCTMPGIHRERSGVFVSMAQGAKDILVWPPQATGLPLGSARYQEAIAGARRLRCAPGRLIYWPAMHWHLGESPGQGTAGLHIAVLDDALTVRDLLTDARELDAEVAPRFGPAWSTRSTWSAAGSHELALPLELDAAVESVVTAYADRAVVRDRLVAGWLRRRTALGFPAVPPPRRVTLAPDHVLTRDGVHPIIVARRDTVTSWVAADGRVGYARSVPSLVPLIDRLNSGRPITVAAALDLTAAPLDRDVVMRVLTLLASWQALATSAMAQAAPPEAAAPAATAVPGAELSAGPV